MLAPVAVSDGVEASKTSAGEVVEAEEAAASLAMATAISRSLTVFEAFLKTPVSTSS